MKNEIILKNLKIEEKIDESKKNLSSFVFNGLPGESAITIGNYYRRIILSYMNGISIFGLKISNKNNQLKSEFSILEGLVETPPYLIMNLKKVIFSLKSPNDEDQKKIFNLKIDIENNKDSEYIVNASDIFDLSDQVKILSPDVQIGTLAPFSSLVIDIYCRNSWGFKRGNEETENKNSDLILIDGNYNPILNVSCSIDFVVTGLDTQDEKLVLKIETDGSISPKQSLLEALKFSSSVNQKILSCLEGVQEE